MLCANAQLSNDFFSRPESQELPSKDPVTPGRYTRTPAGRRSFPPAPVPIAAAGPHRPDQRKDREYGQDQQHHPPIGRAPGSEHAQHAHPGPGELVQSLGDGLRVFGVPFCAPSDLRT
ncbi:hypothetical protein GCM10007147_38740 [Nocardiopsis kunsanensis]|uniref:Uncharacterized protein n=1 Tax=Nocardiopsis kunsanensis TaxID=141693 RepID=A0A918XIJ6_9ACTN|nr:hypothetical protein GCM10007147_38740 [Nocardiopsis kunsanensis]